MIGILLQALRNAVPYLCPAVGGSLTERSGVIDLALEAKLLFGAFAAAVAAHATGSVWAGIAAAMFAGAMVGGLQLALSVAFRADQVIVGFGLNLLSYGLTRYLLQLLYGSTANSPHTAGVGSRVLTSPVFWVAIVACAVIALGLAFTSIGLRIRAAGERPDALAHAGIRVAPVRLVAVLVGSAVAGLGGAQLALAAHGFTAEMSNGRGYIALTIVILGGWRPAAAVAFALGYGALKMLEVRLQLYAGADSVRALVQLLPYLVTLAVVVIAPGRNRTPRALGRS